MNEFLPFTDEEIKKFGGGKGGSIDKLRKKNPIPSIDKRIKFYDYVVVDDEDKLHPEIQLNVRGKIVDKSFILPDDWKILNHKYFVDGIQMRESLTTWISRFHPEFDEESQSLRCSQTTDPNNKYFGMSQDAVKMKWEDNRVNGTRMHEYIERFYNDMFDETDERYKNPAFARFLKYQREFVINNGLVPFRTELRNFDVADCAMRDQMCGTADMIYMRQADIGHSERGKNVVVVDWKFLGEMPLQTFGRFCHAPFEDLPDTKLYHYYIQLNGYRRMAQLRGLVVTEMIIVDFGSLESKIATYQIYQVPDLQEKIATALRVRHEEMVQHYVSKRKRLTEETLSDLQRLGRDYEGCLDYLDDDVKLIVKKVKQMASLEEGFEPIFTAMLHKSQRETRKNFDKPQQTRINEFLVPK